MKDNSISVVCPAYNSAAFIIDTLKSVLAQHQLPNEVFIVDDGSSDQTVSLIESFAAENKQLPIRLFKQDHLGPGAARNLGIEKATSTWIAFLDSDDLWFPTKIESILSAMQSHPEANFFSHNEMMKNLDGSEEQMNYANGLDTSKPLPPQLYFRNFFSTSTVVCKRDLLLKWKGFNATLSSAQDYELWLRMSVELVPIYIQDSLGTYVMRKGNISTSRFWRRLINILRIKIMHSNKVSFPKAVYTICLTIAYYFLLPGLIWFRGKLKKS